MYRIYRAILPYAYAACAVFGLGYSVWEWVGAKL